MSGQLVRPMAVSFHIVGLARDVQVHRGMSRAARSVATRATARGLPLHTCMQRFSSVLQLVFDPTKEIRS
jgi:hypothetical protein